MASAASSSRIRTASVISSSSRLGLEAGSRKRAGDLERQRLALQLNRRNVDGEPDMIGPGGGLGAGGAQHPIAELVDQAGVFRHGMNSAGEIMPRSGWRQRSSASQPVDLVAAKIDQRLVVDLEAAVDQRLPQILLHGEPRLGAGIHGRLEEAMGAAAAGLGGIHRKIGVLDELVELGAVLRRQRDADRWHRSKAGGRGTDRAAGSPHRCAPRNSRPSAVEPIAVWITANSSPPSRAIRSPRLRQPRMRVATVFNSSSPT